jgi:uncharacterized membrane protein
MLTTEWKGILGILLICIFLIGILFGVEYLIFKICKRELEKRVQSFIIYAGAIVIFGFFQWYIAIFLWMGLFIINCCVIQYIHKKDKDKKENVDKAFLIRVFLSSLIFIFLSDIFSAMKFLGVVLKYDDRLWMKYFYNALCLSGILFVFYSIGFRPWSWEHGLISLSKKSEDRIDVADKIIDAVICVILFILVQIVYAVFYFG